MIIQHVDAQFAAGLGEWLEQESGKRVRLVKSGWTAGGSDIFLAGTNDHLDPAAGPVARLRAGTGRLSLSAVG